MSRPIGPIPLGFVAEDGRLAIAGETVDALVERAGDTPLFVYDLDRVAAQIARFRAAFSGIDLHYAVKANPYEPLLKFIANQVDGLDVASEGELERALASGARPSAISFAGPGKRDRELATAIQTGITINAESEREVDRVLDIAGRDGRTPRLAVRVNPDFELRGAGMRMGGGARPFGVDAERVPALVRRILAGGADWRGFHVFAGSQALSAEALIETQRATLALAARLADEAGSPPPLVNIGGGFGIPYVHGDRPLDVEAVGAALGKAIQQREAVLEGSRFAIELGRWLVGEAGVYLTRIVDRKSSHGRLYLVTDGGMHHQLAAAGQFGQVVRRNFPVAIATRFDAPPEENVDIVGCLCTPLDRLADDVMMPRAMPGDLIVLFLAGAYGLSASPQAFLDQPPAREMVVGGGAAAPDSASS